MTNSQTTLTGFNEPTFCSVCNKSLSTLGGCHFRKPDGTWDHRCPDHSQGVFPDPELAVLARRIVDRIDLECTGMDDHDPPPVCPKCNRIRNRIVDAIVSTF